MAKVDIRHRYTDRDKEKITEIETQEQRQRQQDSEAATERLTDRDTFLCLSTYRPPDTPGHIVSPASFPSTCRNWAQQSLPGRYTFHLAHSSQRHHTLYSRGIAHCRVRQRNQCRRFALYRSFRPPIQPHTHSPRLVGIGHCLSTSSGRSPRDTCRRKRLERKDRSVHRNNRRHTRRTHRSGTGPVRCNPISSHTAPRTLRCQSRWGTHRNWHRKILDHTHTSRRRHNIHSKSRSRSSYTFPHTRPQQSQAGTRCSWDR